MKVAITGATGFIGRHVVPNLVRNGAEVVVTTRIPQTLYTHADRLSVVTLDISVPDNDWFERLGKPDVLLHLAWGGLPNYHSNMHLTQELPTQYAFLNNCLKSGLRRLVVTGTCLEYGMQTGLLHENLPTLPCTAYGEAKTRLHRQIQKLHSSYDFQFTWLRLFYLYGPDQAPTSLYSQLRAAVAEGRNEFPMSPGDQLRDFLPVEQAAVYIRRITMGPHCENLVNICSGVPRAVSDIVQEWLREWHAKIQLKLGIHPYPDYEPMAFWGSTERLQSLLRVLP